MKHKSLIDYTHIGGINEQITILPKGTIFIDYTTEYKGEVYKINPLVIDNNPEYFEEVNWKQELRLYFKSNKTKLPDSIKRNPLPVNDPT